jgi:tripartite-type tricarboxylate transporter receptor subunit TctC
LSVVTSIPCAAEYPERVITLIVPSPPGGGTDSSWRMIAPKFAELLGQKIVIENRPGASGNIGAAIAAKAAPDGYTLLAFISSHAINPSLMKQIPYDLERDFIPVSRTVTVPGVVVSNAAVPTKTLGELIAYAKSRPAQLNFGSAGIGSMSHLMMELFQDRAGVKLLHVPYRGTAPALNDVLGDHVTLTSADLTVALPHIRAGRLRAYGVTSSARAPIASEIPTLAEAGLAGYEALQWFGLVVPAGTPRAIVDTLFANLVKALDDPAIKQRFIEEGITPAPSASPEEFAAFIRAEAAKWAKVIKDNDIKGD